MSTLPRSEPGICAQCLHYCPLRSTTKHTKHTKDAVCLDSSLPGRVEVWFSSSVVSLRPTTGYWLGCFRNRPGWKLDAHPFDALQLASQKWIVSFRVFVFRGSLFKDKSFDRHLRLPEGNPPIGLLLCKGKKDAIVELPLPMGANIHAREYHLYLLPRKCSTLNSLNGAAARKVGHHT